MKASTFWFSVTFSLGLLAQLAGPARADLIPVPLGGSVNANLRTYTDGFFYPVAPTTLTIGGVPFNLAPFDSVPNSLGVVQTAVGGSSFDIHTNIAGASTVYALINSAYGEIPFTVGSVEFRGANGSDVTFNLTEGFNIRDHFFNVFNNTVTDPTIVTETFGPGGFQNEVRLDRLTFVLPASFHTDTLTDIIFSSTASADFPNGIPFLAGVTVATVPEPGTLALFGVGVLGLLGFFGRRESINHA
jgi:hypothetical protein